MLSIPIGRMRHRITLQRFEEGEDEYGATVSMWVSLGTFWASVEPTEPLSCKRWASTGTATV